MSMSKAAVIAALVAVLSSMPCWSQASNGRVSGTVQDESHAVVPNANIDLTNPATGVTHRSRSNDTGFYAFPGLVPGTYQLAAEVPGMQRFVASVVVQVQQSVVVNPVMRVAQTTSTVEVVEATPLVTTDNPTLGRVLERTRIEQLPINGRSVTSLLVTIPGMEGNRAYGMREGSQELVLDGADLTDRFLGGDPYRLPSLESMQEFKVENNSSSAKFARPTSIVLSTKSGTNAFHGSLLETHRNNAIGKARRREDYYTKPPHLIRNEFGGSAGGPVIIPHLYNGTNRTFWFFAYEGNRAITATTKSYHVPTEAFRKGDFTGLVDAQGRLLQLYDPMTTDSTTWARQSFSYGGRNNVIDPARISPLAKQLFAITPLPTLPQVNPLIDYNWWGPVPNITRQWTTTARFDHRLSDKDNLYARYTQGDSYNFSDFLSQPMLNNVAGTKRVLQPNRSLALSHTHVFSPSFFHELLLSASRSKLFIGTGEPGVKYNEQLGLPNPFDVAGWPGIYNTGLSTYYFETENTQQTPFTNYVADSNFTKITGKHELQFGGHFRIDQLNYMPEQQQIQGNDNFYTFATSLYDPASSRTNPLATSLSGHQLANMFLGVANYGNNFVRGYFYARAKEYAGYFQDNYRVNSRLTLNFGLRWEYWPPYSEKRGVLTSFDPQKKAIVLGSSVDNLYQLGATMPKIVNTYTQMGAKFMTYDEAGLPRDLMNGNSANFGPRIGFAYRLSEGKSPTVLRGGYRISYFPVPLSTWGRRMRMNAPLTAPFLNYMILPETSPDGIANLGLRSVPTIIAGQNSTKAVTIDSKVSLSRGSATVSYFNPDQPDSRPMDWNLTLERQVAHSTVVKASYVGNHVDNLEMYYRYNEAPTTYLWYVNTGLAVPTGEYSAVARRPFDQQVYGTIEEYQKTGWSNYHGMQFEIERRYSNGLAFQVFYNLGNAMTAGGRSYSAVIYGLNQYLPGAVPTDLQERSRFLNYQRDTTIPRQRLRWNWVADLPFGKGKRFAGNASGLLDKIVGGWQLTGLGYLRTTDWALPTNIYPTGDAIELYGEKYPIQDCRGGTCVSGYLYWNGYIPSNRINSYDADGKPNGVMGVPSDYKPAGAPLIPWGSTTLPANAPANTNISSFWGTNTVWVKLKDGSVQRTTYDNNLHPWRQQYFPGPRSWGMDASLVKNVPIHESISLRVSADLFNVLNHPNNSSGITGEGLMVTRTSGVAARELQLGMRLTW